MEFYDEFGNMLMNNPLGSVPEEERKKIRSSLENLRSLLEKDIDNMVFSPETKSELKYLSRYFDDMSIYGALLEELSTPSMERRKIFRELTVLVSDSLSIMSNETEERNQV